ncbi:MAG TPA: VIT1/CCC1 transporter family protein [Vicinamibacterales bacterium]|jgi:hypothetical protein|nr:VIT1/CCC1 transporter family protein [Vicinamibacterales bacterium]
MTVADLGRTAESNRLDGSTRRVLDPVSRLSEILFGLIMALTFTGSISVAESGRDEVRTLLVGAVGCNIAWGIVDAVMFLMDMLAERGRDVLVVRAVRTASTASGAERIIRDHLPDAFAHALTPAEIAHIRSAVLAGPISSHAPGLERADWLGALAVFLVVVLSTFPVVLPFLFIDDVALALRASNAVAIVMLFGVGYLLARHAGYRPWRTGLAMVLLGVVLVGLTIALGG